MVGMNFLSKGKNSFRAKQNTAKRLLSLVMVAVIATGFITVRSENAFATSDFDSIVDTTAELNIWNTWGSQDYAGDVTNTYLNVMQSTCASEYDRFVSALSDPNGRWVVTLDTAYSSGQPVAASVHVRWTTNSSASAEFVTVSGGHHGLQISQDRSVSIGVSSSNNGEPTCYWDSGSHPWYIAGDNFASNPKIYLSTYPITYPTGYEGALVPDGSTTDLDRDGLSDYIESPLLVDRDDIFCDTTATPHTCSYPNPIKKDVYVEIDWMDDGLNSDKPTSTQLSLVEAGLESNGYIAHLDAGEYGGGGALPVYVNSLSMHPTDLSTSFFDFKNGD